MEAKAVPQQNRRNRSGCLKGLKEDHHAARLPRTTRILTDTEGNITHTPRAEATVGGAVDFGAGRWGAEGEGCALVRTCATGFTWEGEERDRGRAGHGCYGCLGHVGYGSLFSRSSIANQGTELEQGRERCLARTLGLSHEFYPLRATPSGKREIVRQMFGLH